MANRSFSSFLYLFALLSILSLLFNISRAESHFEGFEAEEEDDVDDDQPLDPKLLRSPPLTQSELTPPDPIPLNSNSAPHSDLDPKPSSSSDIPTTAFDSWDEDEFEGIPAQNPQPETNKTTEIETAKVDPTAAKSTEPPKGFNPSSPRSYTVEIVCGSFLVMFAINYFTGKRQNENIALAWATNFAIKDSIFEKNFSLLGTGEGEDSPLLLKEGQNVFKFYASGRRYCQGLLATLELQSRHDLISRVYNMIVPTRDEITFEVYMNEDAMDHVICAIAKKKAAKAMQKDVRDLQRFAGIISSPPSGRKWVVDELSVISESKEVAGDLISEAVLDQVFGEKAYEKYGKGFISMHFSDQHLGIHKKMLIFKFAIPDAKNMANMTRLVALIPYYVDFIGRYKLSSQARSKTEASRLKAAQEAQKELQNARQEALQRRKAERKKMLEEGEAKLSAEAIRKKEAKERARQMKKAMPKMKMARA